jgi:hypothetical protein
MLDVSGPAHLTPVVSAMTSKRQPTYPFVPRSTATLLPGQFWAIPLSDGSFGCGRVIELKASGTEGARVTFLAAVMDWHGDKPPTPDSLAGAKCLAQGQAHVKAITERGGSILGHRSLGLDDIEPWEFRGAEFHVNSFVHRGMQPVRPQKPEDGHFAVLSTWGYRVPAVIAERHFTKRTQ